MEDLKETENLPFDSEPSYSWLLFQEFPDNSIDLDLLRWLVDQLFRIVLVANIVTNANKFATIVRTSEKHNGNTEDLRAWELSEIGRLGLEDELVDTYGDGANKERVEFLVMFGTVVRKMCELEV